MNSFKWIVCHYIALFFTVGTPKDLLIMPRNVLLSPIVYTVGLKIDDMLNVWINIGEDNIDSLISSVGPKSLARHLQDPPSLTN